MQITVINVPKTELGADPDGFADMIFSGSREVLCATFGGPLEAYARRHSGGSVRSLVDVRRLGDEDHATINDAALTETSRFGLALDAVRVNAVDVGGAFALSLRRHIEREFWIVAALKLLRERGVRKLVVLMPGIGATERAILARLLDGEFGDLIAAGEIRQSRLHPLSIDSIQLDFERIMAFNEDPREAAGALKQLRLPALKQVIQSTPRPKPAEVLIAHLSDQTFLTYTTEPLVEALQSQDTTCSVLAAGRPGARMYKPALSDDHIMAVDPTADMKAAEAVTEPVVDAIAAILLQKYSWRRRASSLSPAFFAIDRAALTRSVEGLLRTLAAVNLALGYCRPRSVYLNVPPYASPAAHLVCSATVGRSEAFYAFSTAVTERRTDMPFVAPARLLGYGDQVRDVLRTRNPLAAGAISITGSPRFDRAAQIDPEAARQTINDEFRAAPDDRIVVISLNRSDPAFEDAWLARYLRWTHEQGGAIKTIIRAHPRRSVGFEKLEKLAKGRKWEHVAFRTSEGDNLIAGCDLVITDRRSAAVEAAIHDKDLVEIGFGGEFRQPLSYKGAELGFTAESEAHLKTLTQSTIMEPGFIPEAMLKARGAFLEDLAGDRTGLAARRMALALTREDLPPVTFDSPFSEVLTGIAAVEP
ncbi:MAG: hypothetical protein AAFX09_12180 [Pseudomonadota bacterium]